MTLINLFTSRDLQNWELEKGGLTPEEARYEYENYSICGCYVTTVPCLEECETHFFRKEELEEVDCPICHSHLLTEKDNSLPCPVCYEAEQYKEMHAHYPWRYEERLKKAQAC